MSRKGLETMKPVMMLEVMALQTLFVLRVVIYVKAFTLQNKRAECEVGKLCLWFLVISYHIMAKSLGAQRELGPPNLGDST
jgi:uncharacterized membrane protein